MGRDAEGTSGQPQGPLPTPHHPLPLQDLHDRLPKKLYWQGRHFRLLYNRQLDTSTSYEPDWEHGPATRPDYTIERTEPLEIRHAGELIWREPPVVLDAKYYLASHNSKESDAWQIWQIFEQLVTRSGSDFAAFETWAHTMCT
ncbi:MAG: hypothetical protein J2P37_21210, partial [Ktedonobacteraceae bacterium]|nr:hypothetical protein [Ktedonobacteraceae bacterium]